MVEIIVAGRSNVGKSTIIRQLTGRDVDVGKRPGVTQDFESVELGKNLEILDLPGFGYIAGLSEEKQDEIKTKIVHYLEKNKDRILLAIQVIDTTSFLEIADRWENRGQIPVDIELFSFLEELELSPIVAANKVDKIKKSKLDEKLDEICKKLGLDPPWRQWLDIIVPVSGKTGRGISDLKDLVRERFRDADEDELLRYL